MNNLGRIYKEQERYDEALELLLEAAEGHAHLEGEPHHRTGEHLIDIYTAQGRLEEAEKWKAKLPETADPNEKK